VVPVDASEPLLSMSPKKHHHMSVSHQHPVNILRWTDEYLDDSATRVSIPPLHLALC
jgi:hypothetical protein